MTGGLLFLIPATGATAVLADYQFQAGSWASSANAPGTGVTNASSGNPTGVLLSAGSNNLYYQFSTQIDKATAVSAGYYVEFTVTPDVGNAISYTSLTFDYGASTPFGPGSTLSFDSHFFVRSSLDGFTGDLAAATYRATGPHPVPMTPETLTLTLSDKDEFQNLSEALTFRVYSYTESIVGEHTQERRPRVDNLQLNGVVAPIPEPSTVAFLATALAGFAAFALRRHKTSKSSV